jgi:hypothetical protein
MVNKGKSQPVISLDSIHHKIVVGSKVVELQPLTFALFARLLEHKNRIVSDAVLTDEVWGNVTVSPATLKQRIFLLRKALEEAHVEDCFVQSVRGQGYRLVVRAKGRAYLAVAPRRQLLLALGLAATLILAAIYSKQWWQPYDPPPNNRVVFWSDVPTDFNYDDAARWAQIWMSQLSLSDKVILVAAERNPAQSLTNQARETRAALISLWTLFESDDQRLVRMQILEPKTTGTLRSDLVVMDDSDEMTRLLTAQTEAIERIVESGTLPLLTDSLNNTDHPAWARLRKLASDPE